MYRDKIQVNKNWPGDDFSFTLKTVNIVLSLFITMLIIIFEK